MGLEDALKIDPARVTDEIALQIRGFLSEMRRRGAVLGVSGGVDSSVVAALCVRALGKDRVLGLFMPEADSSPDSLSLGRLVTDTLGIATELEDISAILEGAGCYSRRDKAIRSVIPEYDATYKCKIVLPDMLGRATYQLFSIVVRSPEGVDTKVRLPLDAYLAIVAATNFKQRTRKMLEYYHADRLNYAVAGTPNMLELDQGFFVKNGDGAADFKPIAHLYKSQVYQLAE
jgi:NAD+ synthase